MKTIPTADNTSMVKKEPSKRISILADAEARYAKWFEALDSKKRTTYLIVAILIGLVAVTATSILAFFNVWDWIYTIVGLPAGVILAIIVFTFVEVKGKLITKYKENNTPRIRMRHVIIGGTALLVTLLMSGTAFQNNSFAGVGGMVIVASFLIAVELLTRTEEEFYYYANGLVDPREPITTSNGEDEDD